VAAVVAADRGATEAPFASKPEVPVGPASRASSIGAEGGHA